MESVKDDLKRSNMDHTNEPPSKRQFTGSRIELRFLIPSKMAGVIIGKGGSNIKRMREEYSAKVVFTLEGEPDTLQSILRDLFNALLEESAGRDSHQGAVSSTGEIDMRLLVHQSQAGCVIGKAGAKIKELREESRLRALKMVLELLELAPPKGQVANYDARNFDEFNYEQYGGWIGGGQTRSVRPDGIGNMGGPVGYGAAPPHHMGRGGMPPQPAAPQAMQRGGPQLGGPPMGGAMQPGAPPPPPGAFGGPRPGAPRGMETTQQVSIPDSLTGSIMGRGGQRIKQIRMESGADIKIDKGEPGQDRIITIRGSQEQIQNAQYLLQMW
uniref:Heterogeneous nuclear ribonucleoprotein K n=1 Tax=Macrostomum lignano TaxID=282301 RepID=A0A1I8GDR1_9PLAT